MGSFASLLSGTRRAEHKAVDSFVKKASKLPEYVAYSEAVTAHGICSNTVQNANNTVPQASMALGECVDAVQKTANALHSRLCSAGVPEEHLDAVINKLNDRAELSAKKVISARCC